MSQAPASPPDWARTGPSPRRRRPPPHDRHLRALVVGAHAFVDEFREAMRGQNVAVTSACDPVRALFTVGRAQPDVVVFAPAPEQAPLLLALQVLREQSLELPIIVAVRSDDGELATRAIGLECAVTAHPFRPGPLVQLVRSLAPAALALTVRPPPIDLGRLQVDRVVPEIWLDGAHIVLPAREHRLLQLLAERVGTVVTHAEIGDAVWGSTRFGGTSTVAVHIGRLRRRLSDTSGGASWIRAVRGIGYQLEVPPNDPEPTDHVR